MVSFWTEPILVFWIFMKNTLLKWKVGINYFDEQEKPWIFFKTFQKKNKNFKAICVFLNYSKPRIFLASQTWWPTFFQTLAPSPLPPTILVLLQSWNAPKNVYSVAFFSKVFRRWNKLLKTTQKWTTEINFEY